MQLYGLGCSKDFRDTGPQTVRRWFDGSLVDGPGQKSSFPWSSAFVGFFDLSRLPGKKNSGGMGGDPRVGYVCGMCLRPTEGKPLCGQACRFADISGAHGVVEIFFGAQSAPDFGLMPRVRLDR